MTKKSRRHTTPELNFVPDDIVNYDSIQSLETLCSADDIISRMKYDSTLIFTNLRKGNTRIDKILPFDPYCLCKLGWGERPYVNKNACIGCEMLRRISPSIRVPEDRIIHIEVGKYEGKSYKVIESNENFGEYELDEDNKKFLIKCVNEEVDKGLKQRCISDYISSLNVYRNSSKLTNYILTSNFINNKLQKYRIPLYTPYVWSFSCENKVKIIEFLTKSFSEISQIQEYHKSEKLATANIKGNILNNQIVVDIFKQLGFLLYFLQKYEFIHGSPSIHYLKFSQKSCNFKYDSFSMKSPITLHINPSSNCSFEFENDNGELNRYSSSNNIYLSDMETSFPVEQQDVIISPSNEKYTNKVIDIPILEDLNRNLIYSYKVGDYLPKLKNFHQRYCIPVLSSSFEAYCFLVSLMCEDSFYSSFVENESLLSIWYSLWKISEYEHMMDNLNNLRKLESIRYKEISYFLSLYTLRCDIIDHLWDCISKIL